MSVHVPVLVQECVTWLDPQPGGRFIDCTVNGGGHAAAILERTAPTGTLLGLDADPAAIACAREHLAPFGPRVTLVHSNFRFLGEVAERAGFRSVDGVLLDLGVSSAQLEASGRGFTFGRDEPLDLRFDPTTGRTAADIVSEASRTEIQQLLRSFGEEPQARTIAARIEAARAVAPITTTSQLVALIPRPRDRDRHRIHPATRTFQALRIAVNDELRALAEVLPQALAALRRGGRLAVISFHSLEDRIVKTFLRQRAGLAPDSVDPKLPVRPPTQPPDLRILTKRPVVRSPEEMARNPRSRSARLRVAERL